MDQPHGHAYPPTSPSQVDQVSLPDHRNSPRLARDALVLGPMSSQQRSHCTPSVNPTQTVPQWCSINIYNLHAWCLGAGNSRTTVEVAERIAAPQRSSTRTIYKSKWALFEKWCRENSVDFSTPSVKQIARFLHVSVPRLKHLMVTGLQSLTLWAQHIAHNADLHRLLSSFTKFQKFTQVEPFCFLNELTKPFEPMKDSDLKHLTLKKSC